MNVIDERTGGELNYDDLEVLDVFEWWASPTQVFIKLSASQYARLEWGRIAILNDPPPLSVRRLDATLTIHGVRQGGKRS